MKGALGLLTVVALSGCASARVEGASLVAPGSEPTGTTLGHWKMDDCRDASGGSIPASAATIGLVRMIDGKVALTDAESDRDTLVVSNGTGDPGTRIFRVHIKGAATKILLREYRLPASGDGPGRFSLVNDVQSWTDRGAGVLIANHGKATLSCALVRV